MGVFHEASSDPQRIIHEFTLGTLSTTGHWCLFLYVFGDGAEKKNDVFMRHNIHTMFKIHSNYYIYVSLGLANAT